MRVNRKLLAVLLLALASVAAAQKVYRSVGPDGKVVFSDTPPVDREAVPLPAGRAKPVAATTPTAAPATDTAGKTDASGPSHLAIKAAAAGLAILTDTEALVRSFETTCTAAAQGSASRYSSAAGAWRGRHGELLAKRDAALVQLPPERRQAIQAHSRSVAQGLMQPIHQGPLAQRVKWCDQSAEEITAGKLDKHNDPAVTGPMKALASR